MNCYQHVAVFGQLRFPADLAMPGDDDGLFSDSGQVRFRRLDHTLDIAAGGIIDERIVAVPPGVAAVKHVSLNKVG